MFDVIIDIQIVRTGSLSKAVNDGARLGTADRIDRHPVLPADRKIPQESFFHFLSARNAVNKYKKATKMFTLNCSLWLFLNFY